MAAKGTRIIRSLFLRMIIAALVAGVAAVWFSGRIPPTYRARTLLLMAPMPFNDSDPPQTKIDFYADDPAPRPNWLRVGYLASLPMPDYAMLLTSDEMAAKVRDFLNDEAASRDLNVSYTVEKVRRSMEVNTKIFKQTQLDIKYQQVVELFFSGSNPELAAMAANFWAQESIRYANEMRFIARDGALEYFDERMAETEALLETERSAVAAVERENNPEVLEQQLNALVSARTSLELSSREILAGIAKQEAVAAQLEEEYARATEAEASSVREQMANSEWERDLAKARAELAGMRAEQARLAEETEALGPEIASLESALADARHTMSTHGHKVRYYETQLDELAMSQYATRMQSGDMTPEFKVASAALVPQEKIGPMRSLIVVVAIFLAVLVVPVHFFSMHALRRYVRQIEQEF